MTVPSTLSIEPTYRVLLGDADHFRILQVGCGGTGSALALALGGLAYHARQKGIQVDLTLVDHDVVEERNVGRQGFTAGSASSGGIPKCADLALRLNCAFGLNVTAWPVAYTPEVGERWLASSRQSGQTVHLLADCVDNTAARQVMNHTLTNQDGHFGKLSAGSLWQLSCGNERTNGQVLLGNTNHPERIRFDKMGLCTGLPYPYRQEPGLLEPEETKTATSAKPVLSLPKHSVQAVSCAMMAQQEAQSLMINRLVAAVAGHLLTEMILQKQVTQMGATFNLSPLVMQPRLVTRKTVENVSLATCD